MSNNSASFPLFTRTVRRLSVLQHNFSDALSALTAVAWHRKHDDMEPFYLSMDDAHNFMQAAIVARDEAARLQFDEVSVNNFDVVTRLALERAITGMEFGIKTYGRDVNNAQRFLDALKAALAEEATK